MATLTITVAGVNRTSYLCGPGAGDPATFEEALRERKRFALKFLDRTGVWFPLRGQGITVSHSTLGTIFGGYITTATRHKAPGSDAVFTKCTCVSYEQIMSRRLSIARTWVDQTAGGIFNEIIAESLTDEGFTTEFETGPTIPLYDIQEPRPTVREALDRLCELASTATDIYYWDASPTKVARFFRQDTYAAPWSVTDANPDVLESLAATVDETNQGIVNRVFVYLGQFLLDAAIETFPGDGTARDFEVAYPVGEEPAITVDRGSGPVEETVAVAGGVDVAQWYYTLGSNQIQQDAAEPVLTATDELAVTYRGIDRRAVGPFDDSASGNAEGVLQGNGTGLYEQMLQLEEVGTTADAESLAQAWLDRYSTATITFRGSTYTAGLRSGQELTINLTTLGINLTMLIQSVTMTDAGAGNFLWTFTAIYGAARDDWKRALLGQTVSTSISGAGAGPPATPGEVISPTDFTIDTLMFRWAQAGDGVIAEVLIPVTPPTPIGTTEGGHIYVELEDQSSTPASARFRVGSSTVGGGDGLTAAWDLRDIARLPYVASEQPWVIQLPDVPIRRTTIVRVYVEPYSEAIDAVPIRNGETDETPNATVTITPYQAGKPSSGSHVTTELIQSVVATAAAPVLVSGRLLRPISVTVVLPANPPDNWAYQLVGYVDGDLSSSPVLATGVLSRDVATDPVPAGDDGITTPHTFGNDEPAELQDIVIYAVAGRIMSKPVPRGQTPGPPEFVPNNIVPGITASDDVSIGTVTGVINAANLMLSSYSSEFHVNPTTGKWEMNEVDFSKATHFGAQFTITGGTTFEIDNLSADLIIAGRLQVGGPGMVSQVKNFDTSGNLIGWVGDDTGVSGFVGAWFKRILIGGTSPASAQIIADSNGNVAINGALLVSGTVYLGALGTGALPVGVTYAGTILVSQLGSGTLPVGVVYAGTINVSQLAAGTITVGGGSAGIDVLWSGTNNRSRMYPTLFELRNSTSVAVFEALESGGNGALVGVKNNSGNSAYLYSTGANLGLFINAFQVVTSRQAAVTAPSGGAVQDAESRTAINAIINRLQTHGLIS